MQLIEVNHRSFSVCQEMPIHRRELEIVLSHEDRIHLVIETERGEVTGFSVNYEALIAGRWRPMVRYDDSHGFCHKDVYYIDGTQRKIPLASDRDECLTAGLRDIRANWETYRQRYEEQYRRKREQR